MTQTTKHDDWLNEQLKDSDFAAHFLNSASEDDNPHSYLLALRKVVDARCGMTLLAEKTNLSRENLHRMLSARGNPTIKTLKAVLKATGLDLNVTVRSYIGERHGH